MYTDFFRKNTGSLKVIVFSACLIPVALMIWQIFTAGLGTNPIEEVTYRTGDWTLRFVCITLAVTPIRRITGWQQLIRFRRMLGLFAFFYALLHFMTYIWLDQFFDFREIISDIVERPYITVGFTAFLLMIPMAVTSTKRMMQRLKKHWNTIHYAMYGVAILGVIHFWWLVKADIREPAIYALIVSTLLVYRLIRNSMKKQVALGSASIHT